MIGNVLVTFEAFKVFEEEAHEIHAVNALFRIMPKETTRGGTRPIRFPLLRPWAAH